MPWLLAVWAVGIGAWDLRHRRIPNWALAIAVIATLGLLLVGKQGPLGAGWAESLAGAALCAAVWLPGYLLHKLGAGDVKFAACIGLLLGIAAAVEAMLLSAAVLGLMAAGAALSGYRRARLPAAVALAGGMLLRVFWGPLWLG